MYSARRSILAALLFASSLSGTPAFSQAVRFVRHATDPLSLAKVPASRLPCVMESDRAAVTPYAATPGGADAGAPCDTQQLMTASVNPLPRDLVQEELASMGKQGQKILRARERVLEILQAENACSAWFREKDPNPAATFRTLSYEVDLHGEEVVHVSRDMGADYIYREPYVARVGQDTGAFATVTLNAGGAFFHAQSTMQIISKDGGLLRFGGPRSVSVGPYTGDSLPAQTLALLHEFGHVLDLLPTDFDNQEGRSMRNTREVLRYCRSQIESKAKRGALSAAR